jgi:hypothetical protein
MLPHPLSAVFNMAPCRHVEENTHATPKQAKKNNALAESTLFLSHSCGAL